MVCLTFEKQLMMNGRLPVHTVQYTRSSLHLEHTIKDHEQPPSTSRPAVVMQQRFHGTSFI
jgi:hypothetical protein